MLSLSLRRGLAKRFNERLWRKDDHLRALALTTKVTTAGLFGTVFPVLTTGATTYATDSSDNVFSDKSLESIGDPTLAQTSSHQRNARCEHGGQTLDDVPNRRLGNLKAVSSRRPRNAIHPAMRRCVRKSRTRLGKYSFVQNHLIGLDARSSALTCSQLQISQLSGFDLTTRT